MELISVNIISFCLCAALLCLAWKTFIHVGMIIGNLVALNKAAGVSASVTGSRRDISEWRTSLAESNDRAMRSLRFLAPTFILAGLSLIAVNSLLTVTFSAAWFAWPFSFASLGHTCRSRAAFTHTPEDDFCKALRDRRGAFFATRSVLEALMALALVLL
jgi:hypothetical protein